MNSAAVFSVQIGSNDVKGGFGGFADVFVGIAASDFSEGGHNDFLVFIFVRNQAQGKASNLAEDGVLVFQDVNENGHCPLVVFLGLVPYEDKDKEIRSEEHTSELQSP